MKLPLLTEKELISAIREEFDLSADDLVLGIGDDTAVVRSGGRSLLVTKDLLIEDTHFIKESHPPFLLGRKSLNVNISDIAAMGGVPRFALLGIGLPSGMSSQWIESFFTGLNAAGIEFGVLLIGGDVTRADKIVISITLIGEGDHIIRRGGANTGDSIWVSGTLGDSALGLRLMKEGYLWEKENFHNRGLKAFLDPQPQVELGRDLSAAKIPSAMIDISDGLSVDLGHICEESGVGAEVELERIPLSPAVRSRSEEAFDLALHGGEDYQLLFTVPDKRIGRLAELKGKYRLSRIGIISAEKGIFQVEPGGLRKPLAIGGFQHFSKKSG